MAASSRHTSPGAGSWNTLFDFLDPSRPGKSGLDRDAAAEAKLEEITRKLTYFFASRGCGDAEDLAAETTLRVAAKSAALSEVALGERTAYFYGVARNVHYEWLRERRRESARLEDAAQDPTVLPVPNPADDRETEQRCLDHCMRQLTRGARRLVLDYYGAEGTAKIARHRELAVSLGKSMNALRIEVHRIRTTLRRCVVGCVQPRVARTAGALEV